MCGHSARVTKANIELFKFVEVGLASMVGLLTNASAASGSLDFHCREPDEQTELTSQARAPPRRARRHAARARAPPRRCSPAPRCAAPR